MHVVILIQLYYLHIYINNKYSHLYHYDYLIFLQTYNYISYKQHFLFPSKSLLICMVQSISYNMSHGHNLGPRIGVLWTSAPILRTNAPYSQKMTDYCLKRWFIPFSLVPLSSSFFFWLTLTKYQYNLCFMIVIWYHLIWFASCKDVYTCIININWVLWHDCKLPSNNVEIGLKIST